MSASSSASSNPLPNPSPTGGGALCGLLLSILTAAALGLGPVGARAVYADGGNATFIVILSMTVRAGAMALFCLLSKKRLFATRRDTRLAVTGGFFQSVSTMAVYVAMLFLPTPVVIILVYTHTLMLLFFLVWKKQAALDAPTVVTTALALAGLSLVVDVWGGGHAASVTGILIALAAAVTTMSRFYVYGNLTKTRDPAVVGAEALLFAVFFSLLMLFFQPLHVPLSAAGWGWAGMSCAALTASAFGMFYGIALTGAFRFSLLLKLEPVFSALFSAALVGEILNPRQYAGILLVAGSLAAYQYVEYRRRKVVLP